MTADVETSVRQEAENLQTTLDHIISELRFQDDGLPEAALREAQKHSAAITPRLIHAIEEATERAAAGDVPEDNLHFIALFLLAEFRASEALPVIVRSVSLPDDLPYNLYGDAITEMLSRVFATLTDDDLTWLDDLIADAEIEKFVRWNMCGTLRYLVKDGRLSRDAAVQQLHGYLRRALDEEDIELIDALISELTTFSPHEAIHEIREAFRRELVDETMTTLKFVEESIEAGPAWLEDELRHCEFPGVSDACEELSAWYAFGEEHFGSSTVEEPAEETTGTTSWDHEPPTEEPYRNDQPRIGRNEPCPCGSGKKYKRCCQRKIVFDD